MSETRSLVELWRNAEQPNEPDAGTVLVTLVRVEGSSYRKPGARLLTCANTSAGSISGGCLEGEVLRKAAWITQAGAALQRYSTLFDDTSEIPYGLGCGGVVDLLFEPLRLPETQALLAALERSLRGEQQITLTLLPNENLPDTQLQRIVLDGKCTLQFASDSLSAESCKLLIECAEAFLLSDTAPLHSEITLQLGGATRTVFIEKIDPPQRLFIFGAGNDAQPLTRMAHLLGWRVVVADGRPMLARAESFPEAESVLRLPHNTTQYAEAIADLHITSTDAAVLLTHSYEQDRALLPHLLPLGLRYLGLLGARHRSRLLLMESAAQLGWTPEECLARIHAPVGLHLGGDTPESVALSIVAEIQSVLHGRETKLHFGNERSLLEAPALPYVPTICPLDVDAAADESLAQAPRKTH